MVDARRTPSIRYALGARLWLLGKPRSTGWGPDRIARAWAVLMGRLGYKRYVSQGGDWGSVVADVMARQVPPELLGHKASSAVDSFCRGPKGR